MTANGWIQIGLFCVAVLVCVKPLGLYMARVFEGEIRFLAPVERFVYRLCGVKQDGEKPLFRSGDVTVDLVRRIVTARGAEVKLTPREYDLLRLLVSHAGKVLTHKLILQEVWGGEADVQYLRIYIRNLRQKLETDPEQPRLIQTEQGVGYRLAPAD